MKRILVRDLKPGDVFEYQHIPFPRTRPDDIRLKRDTVLPDGPWRCWWGPSNVSVDIRTVDNPPEHAGEEWALIHTEIGQTNHRWVERKADDVVVLIARDKS